jgi:putative membrane protein
MTSRPLTRKASLIEGAFNTELSERRDWKVLLFSVGPLWPQVYPRVLFLMLISLLLCILKHLGFPIPPWKSTVHSVIGVSLGLLLVYRTNASYDRFWEGRKLWGQLFGAAKSMMRFIRTYERDTNAENLANLLTAYAVALKQRLRGDYSAKKLIPYLQEKELEFTERSHNKPVAIK